VTDSYPSEKEYHPKFCCTNEAICPFADPKEGWAEVADPTQAFYHCNLLGIGVWAESPSCLSELSFLDQNQLLFGFQTRLKNSEEGKIAIDKLNKDLIREKKILCEEVASINARAKAKITEMKAEVKQEIKAVGQILKAIKDGQSSHWQKKENIRLALEILEKIPTFDRGDFFSYEDNF